MCLKDLILFSIEAAATVSSIYYWIDFGFFFILLKILNKEFYF